MDIQHDFEAFQRYVLTQYGPVGRDQLDQRMGQWAMNTLQENRPDLSRLIAGSSVDPFYKDSKMGVFWLRLKYIWEPLSDAEQAAEDATWD